MQKKLFGILSLILASSILAACGNGNEKGSADTLVVGASNVPHAEILEEAKPLLEEKGIDLEIKKFQDYVLPNQALAKKELDANYFQHIPYMKSQMEQNESFDFVNAGGIHIEPIGVYSQKYDSLKELPQGAKVIMSNSVADHGRMLSMLESQGVIKLKDGIEKTEATEKDIVENPKDLKFQTDVEAGLLPRVYKNGEGDAVLINTNYAIDAGLNPKKDSIALEGSESLYVNVIAVNKGNENDKRIKTLVKVLRSDEIQNFIEEEYKGAVVPVNE